jgi:hypothetical protein
VVPCHSYKNFVSNIDKPKKVLGFDEDGDILIERSKYSKVKSITNIEEWLIIYTIYTCTITFEIIVITRPIYSI